VRPAFVLAPVLCLQAVALPVAADLLQPHVHDTDGFFAAVLERQKAP